MRPVAVNTNGDNIYIKTDDEEVIFSNLSREDFEVYNRITLFNSRAKRDL